MVCDYATRFSDAFPIWSVTTPKPQCTCSAIFKFSNRHPQGNPVDQGTNFTSILTSQLQKELGIMAIRTSPCHPEMDGFSNAQDDAHEVCF